MRSAEVDWNAAGKLLLASTAAALDRFFAMVERDEVCALGYVLELGNTSPLFDICADTHANRTKCSSGQTLSDGLRFNSGNYKYPAGLPEDDVEQSHGWRLESEKLHNLATDDESLQRIYLGLVRIGIESLATIARSGALGDWRRIDFSISEIIDSPNVIAARDVEVRQLILDPSYKLLTC